jgi:hypothetical protein
MSTATVADYVAKRAELLARLVLTRREGARVIAFEDPQDTGFLVQLPHSRDRGRSKAPQPSVAVYVKGTDDRLEDERRAVANCRELWKGLSDKAFDFYLAPVVFLLFSMEGDQGYFSWVMEPHVDRDRTPSLTRVEAPEMTRISRKSIEELFDRVEEWSEATAEILIRQ